MTDLQGLRRTIWNAETHDFGGYTTRDASVVADALIASDWLVAHDAEVRKAVLAEAEQLIGREWFHGYVSRQATTSVVVVKMTDVEDAFRALGESR